MARRVLILGKTGMLGHLLFDYLSSIKNCEVFGTIRKDLNPLEMSEIEIENTINKYSPDYVVNCIGLINIYANKNEELATKVNGVFPHFLAYLGIKNKWKLIHISTDCYLDEDIYGRSKNLGEINDNHNLTIRTSVIGPEIKEGFGLFHWFMSQKGEINGFTKAQWDGVTTLQLAKFITSVINEGNFSNIVDYRTKESITKYKLLNLISKIFNKDIKIKEDNKEVKDKRNLNADRWCKKSYEEQINELKKYMGKRKNKYTLYLRK